MGVDMTDTSEVVILTVPRPSDLPKAVGRTFTTPWFTMDADRSEQFEFATYLDSYPHPYGVAGDDGYGEGLVEGYHLLGMLDYLLNHVLVSQVPCTPWNYGLDRVRFVSVVRLTDRFRITGTLREVVDRGEQGYLVVLDLVGEVEGRDKPGFVATQRVLWTPAAPEEKPHV
ncbi:hypothetical protein [Nonomuraea sp. NPDC050783]|uniref:hypothetical protein n=1 Tax=Nonomuraea sp. NPDC050783 TaxID=3154634 RepID=UPI003467A3F2